MNDDMKRNRDPAQMIATDRSLTRLALAGVLGNARQRDVEEVTVSIVMIRDAINLIDSNEALLEVAVMDAEAAAKVNADLKAQLELQRQQLKMVNDQLDEIKGKTSRLRAMFLHVGLGR